MDGQKPVYKPNFETNQAGSLDCELQFGLQQHSSQSTHELPFFVQKFL